MILILVLFSFSQDDCKAVRQMRQFVGDILILNQDVFPIYYNYYIFRHTKGEAMTKQVMRENVLHYVVV